MHNDLKRMQVLDAISKGSTTTQACLMAGVKRVTFNAWLRRGKQADHSSAEFLFATQYLEARKQQGKSRRKAHANGGTLPLSTSFLAGETRARLLENIRAGGTFHIAAEAAGLSLASFHAFLKAGQEDQDRGEETAYSQLLRDVYRAAGEARLSAEKSLLEGAPGMWLTHSPMGRGSEPDRPGWHKSDHRTVNKNTRNEIRIVTQWGSASSPTQVIEAGTLPALPEAWTPDETDEADEDEFDEDEEYSGD